MAAGGRRHVGGAGIYWGEDDPRNLAHPILSILDDDGSEIDATNNRAELTAAILAVQMVRAGYRQRKLIWQIGRAG